MASAATPTVFTVAPRLSVNKGKSNSKSENMFSLAVVESQEDSR